MTKVATKTNKKEVVAKETTQAAVQEGKKTADEQVVSIVNKLLDKDSKVTSYDVSGYTTLKFNNNVLCELHFKKRSFSHITFSQKQTELIAILKREGLINRVVPANYHWKFDVECLVDAKFVKHFESLLTLAYTQALPKVEAPKAQAKA